MLYKHFCISPVATSSSNNVQLLCACDWPATNGQTSMARVDSLVMYPAMKTGPTMHVIMFTLDETVGKILPSTRQIDIIGSASESNDMLLTVRALAMALCSTDRVQFTFS